MGIPHDGDGALPNMGANRQCAEHCGQGCANSACACANVAGKSNVDQGGETRAVKTHWCGVCGGCLGTVLNESVIRLCIPVVGRLGAYTFQCMAR